MQHLLCDDVWDRLRQLSKKSKRRSIAVAFLSDPYLVKLRHGDLLIVDASDGRIKCGETSAKALASILRKRTAIFSLPNLHAKVFVFDDTAIIGSTNVSRNSSLALIEAALVTDDRATVSQTLALIESLKEKATKVDSQFIARISKIKVQKRKGAGPSQKGWPKVGNLGTRTWIVGIHEIAQDAFPNETDLAEEGSELAAFELSNRNHDVNWLRFTGKRSKLINIAAKGDSVIQIWTPLGQKAVQVFAAAPILRRQRGANMHEVLY